MWSGRRRLALASTVVGLALLASVGIGLTVGAFSDTTTNSGNSFTAATDWTACTASSTVVAKTPGYLAGYIKSAGTYNVYANVSDTGNPASGVSTVTANVSNIDSGAGNTAVALTSGSYTAQGVSYNYRSANRTAKTLTNGTSYTYSITCTDAASNSGTQSGFTVTADTAQWSGSDIQATNKVGGTAGRAELGDIITYTFSEQIDPESILSGWTGASTNVVVHITNAGGSGKDSVQIWNSGDTAQLPLGSVTLPGGDYVSSNITFGATGTASTMVMSGSSPWTITVTLGTQSAAATTGSSGGSTWTPETAAYDRGGNSCVQSGGSCNSVSETGGADAEF